ncbi:SWET1 protein, partial [Polyodon spathula]|nr:sugar transporter SWEET1 isoform X2 [Polyodon spathula]MBN3276258.1 SWET1 protein [Polyodon spathula]
MYFSRSTENVQLLPFLTTNLNNLGWLFYGYLKDDWTLITVNLIGATLQTVYMLAYFFYSLEKRKVLLQTGLALAVLCSACFYFSVQVPDLSTRLSQLGLFCSVFTISMYLSPLADLAKILQSRSTECLSFPLSVATFLTSTSWTLYGLQLNDLYITVPNTPGVITSLLRFWLFWQYPSTGQDKFSYKTLQA